MKTHLTTSSIKPANIPAAGHGTAKDWKRHFRQNVLDLNPRLRVPHDVNHLHWISEEPELMRLLGAISHDVSPRNKLIKDGDRQPLSTDITCLLVMLGVLETTRPNTVVAKLKFSIRMLNGIVRFHSQPNVSGSD